MNNVIENIEECGKYAIDRFSLSERIVNLYGSKIIAEVGVWKGEYTQHLLTSCGSIEKYYMIDPWKKLDNWNKPYNVGTEEFAEIYREALERTEFAMDRTTIIRETTVSAVQHIENHSLDFVYIDGDHTLRGIVLDLTLMLPKLKLGGVIVGDDFTTTPWQHSQEFEPTLINPFAAYFAEANDLPFIVLEENQYAIPIEKELGYSYNDLTGRYSDLSLLDLKI